MRSVEVFELSELIGELVQEDDVVADVILYMGRERFDALEADTPVTEHSCTNPSCSCRWWQKLRKSESIALAFVTREPPA